MLRCLLFLLFVACFNRISAQSAAQLVVLHETVGASIDSSEKAKYHLFPYWTNAHFGHAEFYRNADSTMFIVGTMRDGSIDTVACSNEEFEHNNFLVRHYAGLIPKENHSNGALIGSLASAATSGIFTFIQIRRQR